MAEKKDRFGVVGDGGLKLQTACIGAPVRTRTAGRAADNPLDFKHLDSDISGGNIQPGESTAPVLDAKTRVISLTGAQLRCASVLLFQLSNSQLVTDRHCERSEAIHRTAQRKNGLHRRGGCHRAGIRATRWLPCANALHPHSECRPIR